MDDMESPFRASWIAAGREPWGCDSTYCEVPYSALPVLEPGLLHGDFQWLEAPPPDLLSQSILEEARPLAPLDRVIEIAASSDLSLPEDFITFFSQPHLQERVYSCTACYLDLSTRLVSCPEARAGLLIRFLNDQCTSVVWHLHLAQDGKSCIVASTLDLIEDVPPDAEFEDAFIVRDMIWCAPTFEEFMYRFWIENAIWFARDRHHPLTPEQQTYLDACKNYTR